MLPILFSLPLPQIFIYYSLSSPPHPHEHYLIRFESVNNSNLLLPQRNIARLAASYHLFIMPVNINSCHPFCITIITSHFIYLHKCVKLKGKRQNSAHCSWLGFTVCNSCPVGCSCIPEEFTYSPRGEMAANSSVCLHDTHWGTYLTSNFLLSKWSYGMTCCFFKKTDVDMQQVWC